MEIDKAAGKDATLQSKEEGFPTGACRKPEPRCRARGGPDPAAFSRNHRMVGPRAASGFLLVDARP
jgi:hypothetical protein